MSKIYIVDDDPGIRVSLRGILEDEDFEVKDFETGSEMLSVIKIERPDLILLDVWLGKEDGLEILVDIIKIYPMMPVLMISGHGTIEQAVAATRKGAVDFLEKPLSLDHVLSRINEILRIKETDRSTDNVKLEFDGIIGVSKQITGVKKAIDRASGTNARVFIYGENGTGKELTAKSIYRNSKRSKKPFIELNCAAVPEEYIESELFGIKHENSSGSDSSRQGKIEMANGGTLFLDEICELSLPTQARMLHVLQENKFVKIGDTKSIDIDVRIIAATNIDPMQAIRDGRFREDLYYSLNVIPIYIPPLRDRKSDIPLLLEHFLIEFEKNSQSGHKKFTPSSLEILTNYNWPGNVRELKNVIERLCIMTSSPEITAEEVRLHLHGNRGADESVSLSGDLKTAREDFERNYIIQALKQNEINISRTARYLGMERTNLHRKMKTLKIDPEKI